MDCSLPGSSVHGIIPARILEQGAVFYFRGPSPPGPNLCLLNLLHWQVDSLPLVPCGKPIFSKRHMKKVKNNLNNILNLCNISKNFFFFLKFIILIEANYFIMLWQLLPYIDMNQPWVYMCPTILKPSSTSLPTPSLQVVTEHQLWVPYFMYQICTGHLFYIW